MMKIKKLIFANILWFILVFTIFVVSAFQRHSSAFWNNMAYMNLVYDLYFLGAFGSLFVFSSVGLLNKKAWGYSLTVAANNSLILLGFIPFLYFILIDSEIDFFLIFTKKEFLFACMVSSISIIFNVLFMNSRKIK